jgi:hypothetical protein
MPDLAWLHLYRFGFPRASRRKAPEWSTESCCEINCAHFHYELKKDFSCDSIQLQWLVPKDKFDMT